MSGKNRINRVKSNFNHNSKLLSGKKEKTLYFLYQTINITIVENIINKKDKKKLLII